MRIWNTLCEKINKKKGVSENRFEKEVALEFLNALNWSVYYGNLKEQYVMEVHGKWIPDFALFIPDKKDPEILVELKKPTHKQQKKDVRQIATYMKLVDCRFGLYFGEKIELFFLADEGDKRVAKSVMSIDFTKDSASGKCLIDLLQSQEYNTQKMFKFCKEQIRLNEKIDYWCSERGVDDLYSFIAEQSLLPRTMVERLRSLLNIHVEKKQTNNPLLEVATKEELPTEENEFVEFVLTEPKKGTNAKMRYYPSMNRYVILSGSKVTRKEAEHCVNEAKQLRARVLGNKHKAQQKGEVFVLLEDCVIIPKKKAPNISAQFCTGRSTDARREWRTKDGKTFNDLFPTLKEAKDEQPEKIRRKKTSQKSSGIFSLDGQTFLDLRHFVLEVTKRFMAENPHLTFEEIRSAFPQRASNNYKTFVKESEWEQKSQDTRGRYFVETGNRFQDKNGVKFLLSTQWTKKIVKEQIFPYAKRWGWNLYER